jgi:hypothetical protein
MVGRMQLTKNTEIQITIHYNYNLHKKYRFEKLKFISEMKTQDSKLKVIG